MDKLVAKVCLKDKFPYLDITIAGRNESEHDTNLNAFLDMVQRRNLTLNDSKSIISTRAIKILGYLIEDGTIKPDTDRLRHLQEFPQPKNLLSLHSAHGMVAYYTKWIPEFSNKIQPLPNAKTFPLDS